MNQGHELANRGDPASLRAAIVAYTHAIDQLARAAPDPANANRLGAALMNRGQIRHQLHGTAQSQAIAADLEQAARILEPHTKGPSPWPRRNLVGALLNHANLLLGLGQPALALAKAEAAIDARPSSSDPTDAELAILARRAACDSLGQLLPSARAADQAELAHAATDRADEALVLIRSLRDRAPSEPFAEASQRLFHFGAQLYALHQPQFLEAFITDHFAGLRDQELDTTLRQISRHAIAIAVGTLSNQLVERLDRTEELAETAAALHQLHQTLSANP